MNVKLVNLFSSSSRGHTWTTNPSNRLVTVPRFREGTAMFSDIYIYIYIYTRAEFDSGTDFFCE